MKAAFIKIVLAVAVTAAAFFATQWILDNQPKQRTVTATAATATKLSETPGVLLIDRSEFGTQVPGAMSSSDGIASTQAGHQPAFVVYGPYWKLSPGSYRSVMEVETRSSGKPPDSKPACKMDVFTKTGPLGDVALSEKATQPVQVLTVEFELKKELAGALIEMRLHCDGRMGVIVRRAYFVRVA